MALASPILLVVVLVAVQARAPKRENGVREGRAIPGVPGQDYPTFSAVPRTGFSCLGRSEGFHADPEARCQVFHICPAETWRGPGVPRSFLCPNGTLFNTRFNTCDWWNKVHCQFDSYEQILVSRGQHSEILKKNEDNYRPYNDESNNGQFISPQTEKIIVDNQVTESKIYNRRQKGFATMNQKNNVPLETEYQNPQFVNRLRDRPIEIEVSSPSENRFSSIINPVTENSIKPRVRYLKKILKSSTDRSLHSLNPIIQVARDSSLLSTFTDPSEEETSDPSPDRIRKPAQRYAVQGVLPQYGNILSEMNPNRVATRDDILQRDQEGIRSGTNIGSGLNNFKNSQDQGEVVSIPNAHISTSLSKPNLNMEEITQTERQLSALFNPINNTNTQADSFTASLPSFSNEQTDNDVIAAFFPGSVLMSPMPTSSTESDLESELVSIFGSTPVVNNTTDIPTSNDINKESVNANFPIQSQSNPLSNDTNIVNDTSNVIQNNEERTTLSTTSTKSPESVNGALNFNFKFGQSPANTDSGENVQTSDVPIYYGQVTPQIGGGSVENSRFNTLTPSDQAYFPNPKINGHYITNGPVDINTVRFQYNRTYQTSDRIPQMIEGRYPYNTVSENVFTTKSHSASLKPSSTGGQRINASNFSPNPEPVNRQYLPAFGYFEPYGEYSKKDTPVQGENYHNNAFVQDRFTSSYHSALVTPPPPPPNSVHSHRYIENNAGYRQNIPSFGYTSNPTQELHGFNRGNYQQSVLGNAFFLGHMPAFENSHLDIPVFPPQPILYSSYPDVKVKLEQPTSSSGSLGESSVTYPPLSQTNSINIPSVNPNFTQIVEESIGSIGYTKTASEVDSSTFSPVSSLDAHFDNSKTPAFTSTTRLTGVDTYSTIADSSQGVQGQFGAFKPSSSPTNTDQNLLNGIQPNYDKPGLSNLPPTKAFVSSPQAPGPTSDIPPLYLNRQSNQNSLMPVLSVPPSKEDSKLSTTEVSINSDRDNFDTSTFRIVYPDQYELSTPLTTQDPSESKVPPSLPTETPPTLGSTEMSYTEGNKNSNSNIYNIPTDVTIATPKPFSPFRPQEQYLPPQLHPTTLSYYYQAGRHLFTPMDIFGINNLPRPSAISITQFSSADIVRSISFSFDNSEEREEFEKARAKGWFKR